MAKEFTITVAGKTQGDVDLALEEVLRLVGEGYGSGFNGNDSGEFTFESTGEYEEEEHAVNG